jgi:hypothetical protein
VNTDHDRWIEELVPSPRRTFVTSIALATLAIAWFVMQRDPAPAASRVAGIAPESETPARTAVDADRALATSEARGSPDAAAARAAPEPSLKIDLATTGWCWIAAESDGERVVYGLVEPGKQLIIEGRHRISLRVGDAGSVRVSINDGPHKTPGAEGEVVELEVTSEDVQNVSDDTVETAAPIAEASESSN